MTDGIATDTLARQQQLSNAADPIADTWPAPMAAREQYEKAMQDVQAGGPLPKTAGGESGATAAASALIPRQQPMYAANTHQQSDGTPGLPKSLQQGLGTVGSNPQNQRAPSAGHDTHDSPAASAAASLSPGKAQSSSTDQGLGAVSGGMHGSPANSAAGSLSSEDFGIPALPIRLPPGPALNPSLRTGSPSATATASRSSPTRHVNPHAVTLDSPGPSHAAWGQSSFPTSFDQDRHLRTKPRTLEKTLPDDALDMGQDSASDASDDIKAGFAGSGDENGTAHGDADAGVRASTPARLRWSSSSASSSGASMLDALPGMQRRSSQHVLHSAGSPSASYPASPSIRSPALQEPRSISRGTAPHLTVVRNSLPASPAESNSPSPNQNHRRGISASADARPLRRDSVALAPSTRASNRIDKIGDNQTRGEFRESGQSKRGRRSESSSEDDEHAARERVASQHEQAIATMQGLDRLSRPEQAAPKRRPHSRASSSSSNGSHHTGELCQGPAAMVASTC